jgi:outer membrane immunogenic protein
MKANYKFARSTAAAFGLIALGLVPSFAADAVMEEPPAQAPVESLPIASWAGPYAGIALGYGFEGRTEVGDPANKIDTDGFIVNGFAGYQLENNGFVYGIEGDAGYAGLKGDNAGVESESGFDGSLRARLGVAVTPGVLLYGTAGGAAQNVEVTDRLTGDSDSATMVGWTAGAGTDVKVTEQVFGRLEYRYSDYGSKDFDLSGSTVSTEAKDHRVTLGVGMKF